MTALASDEARLIRNWAENAAAQMHTVVDMADWVVLNRYRLADLERLAPSARSALQLVMNDRWRELGT